MTVRALRRALLVGVVSVVPLAMTSCSATVPGATTPIVPSAAAAGVSPSVRIDGRTVPFHDLQRWTTASIAERSARTLTVFATGSPDPSQDPQVGGPCGPPALRLHAVETASTVTVYVADYEQPAEPNQACPAIGHVAGPQPVALQQPLGDRAVIDGSTGKDAELLDGADYPDIPTAPSAWGSPVLEKGFPPDPEGIVTRRWSLDVQHGRWVWLESETPQQAREDGPYGAVVQRIDLHGVAATVYRVPNTGYLVQWAPNAGQVVALRLDGTGADGWTAADAVRWARAVTGYRTLSDGRLAQPSSPGTVAAAFNSADGPVAGVQELFKSSGVYVSLDCAGAGTVTVALRGRSYPFACTDALGHHLAESHGAAYQPFTVTVTASPGVRWALTLARASLDGS